MDGRSGSAGLGDAVRAVVPSGRGRYNPHRPLHVLERAFAEVLVVAVKLALEVIVRRAGNADAAWIRQGLEAGRDVDAVAVEIPVNLVDHIAEIDADPEDDASLRWDIGLVLGNALLDGDRARDGIDDRAELHERTVAHQLDNTPVMLGQQRIDHLPAENLQGRQRPRLVLLDEAGIADDISGQDRGQPPLRSCSRHGCLSLQEIRRMKPRRLTRHAPSGCPTPRPCRFMIPLRRSCGDASRQSRLHREQDPRSGHCKGLLRSDGRTASFEGRSVFGTSNPLARRTCRSGFFRRRRWKLRSEFGSSGVAVKVVGPAGLEPATRPL